MIFRILSVFFSFFFFAFYALGQQKYTISGVVKDATNGETLIGANVFNAKNKQQGVAANEYGFYSITLPAGEYNLQVSFIGYLNKEVQVSLQKDLVQNIDLEPVGIIGEAVEVTSQRKDENVKGNNMGRIEVPIEKIKAIPALMGEVDVMRSLQLLPGVRSGGEVNAGFYVRGGGPDQNLILLDEAVVYNTGHLFGFFSVFNADAIKHVTLHKGTMPAEYGGRLSSVLDIQMKEGNNKSYEAEGGIGLISSRLSVQGPVQKGKGSFLVSGRRTYIDVLLQPFIKGTKFEGNGYYFYDLNLKTNYAFSDKDRLFLSGYFGRDVFNFKSPDGFGLRMPWGNATTTLRWNHVFNPKLFMNLTAIYNDYNFGVSTNFQEFKSKIYSGVRDYNAKLDFDYFPNVRHTAKAGLNYTYHTFIPYSINAQIGEVDIQSDKYNKKYAHEIATYIQDDYTVTDKLKIGAGLRYSVFVQTGPSNKPIYDPVTNLPTDTVFYGSNDVLSTYNGLEPRLNVAYTLNSSSSLKAGITYANQYIHLVTNSGSTLPTDLWVPSTQRVKPQRGMQYSAGFFKNFADNKYETSIETYYKQLNNQIEYGEDYFPELNTEIENGFVFGKGKSYGVELFLKKRTGRLNGWIGYTLSRTDRTFPDINGGKTFPAKYDRTHDLSVVLAYELSKRWSIASTFVYSTGSTVTLPNSYYIINGWLYYEYMARNSYRMQPYHRLDFSATCKLGKENSTKKLKSELVFSVYNAYSRLNPFFIYPDINIPTATQNQQSTGNIDVKLKQVSIFPIIPTVTWNFKIGGNKNMDK